MIRKSIPLFALFALLLTSVSCHRQKLEEILYTKALIPVLIDWETRALLDVDNDPDENLYSASVWLFPTAESFYQGDPLECKLSNAVYDYIEVPIGIYDVLVFNNTVGEYSSNVGFRGTDSFDTFEYYTNPYTTSSSSSSSVDGKELRLEPDLLAAWRTTEDTRLVVTKDMIEQIAAILICKEYINDKYIVNRSTTSSAVASKSISVSDFDDLDDEFKQLLNLMPERLTHIITVTECVSNLHSASAALGTMCGMSSSVTLAGANYSSTQTAHYFYFENKYLTSEDGRDGYIDAEFRAIGPLAQEESPLYDLKSLFSLYATYNDSYYYPTPPDDPYSFDVTEQVFDGEAAMGLDKVIPIDICTQADVTLPDVGVGGEGGFEPNVNGWDDEIDVPITL